MKILALEFSFALRSVAVVGDDEARFIQEKGRTGNHPSPALDLLKALEFDAAQIEGIAIGLGPGSYTGIRSALAIAQGLYLARNTPVTGVGSCDVIALEAALHNGVLGDVEVVIDAQRNELYSATYHLAGGAFIQTSPLEIVAKPRTEKIIGPEATRWDPNGIIIFPTAAALAKLAEQKKFGPPELLEPIYLRETSFVKAPAVRHA